MSEWQPIETAPKDGTRIDLWVTWIAGSAARVSDAFWHGGAWCYRAVDEDGGYPWPVGGKPTHWMPVPGRP